MLVFDAQKTMQGEMLNTPLTPANARQVENDKVHVFIVIVKKIIIKYSLVRL